MNAPHWTIRSLTEAVLHLEAAENLLEWEVNGVAPWAVVRWEVVRLLALEMGIWDLAQDARSSLGLAQRLRQGLTSLTGGICHHPWFPDTCRYVIFEHPRRGLIDGIPRDLFTHHLQVLLVNQATLVLEQPFLGGHGGTPHGPQRAWTDALDIPAALVARLAPMTTSPEDRRMAGKIEALVSQHIGVGRALTARIIQAMARFRFLTWAWGRWLDHHRPTTVFLVVAYAYPALVAACRKRGITTCELQHGLISPFHLGYHYPSPSGQRPPYFPDQLLLFGAFWKQAAHFPLPAGSLGIFGAPYITQSLAAQPPVTDRCGVVFLSQGSIGLALATIAVKFAHARPDQSITYKLHPGEYSRWRTAYACLTQAPDNLRVEGAGSHLHGILARSRWQVGVYSTALYEGLALGCRTALVDLPGHEGLLPMVNQGQALVIRDAEDLVRLMDQAQAVPLMDRDAIFAAGPKDLDTLNSLLSNLTMHTS